LDELKDVAPRVQTTDPGEPGFVVRALADVPATAEVPTVAVT
jgi:hypothetical protein